MNNELPETLEEYDKKEARREELKEKMDNLENDPKEALDAAIEILGKYGRSRGWR